MNTIEHYKKKFLGFMRPDQIAEVEITNKGFVYKGNLIVAISGLDLLQKEPEVVPYTYKDISKLIKRVDVVENELQEIEPEVVSVEEKVLETPKVVKPSTNRRKK